MLQYFIIPEPNSHQWKIRLIYHYVSGSHVLKLANWVAGSYMIRDFSRHIMHIQARCNNELINIIQEDKNTWRLPESSGEYQIEYIVYANDLSVRASLLDDERGFIDGACLFLYLPDRRDEECRVEFFRLPKNWQIQTTLPQIGHNIFQAANYTQLTDNPMELGANIEVLKFTAHGIDHRIALSGHYRDFDRARLLDDCQAICEHEISLFQNPPPFAEYLFLLHLGDNIYGGLEHVSSTALHADRNALPKYNFAEADADYTQLLGLIAHEYFHAWNVKSVKPSAFLPYNFDREIYTEQLWAYEGITSYYDDLTLVRSGVISPKNYLNLIAQTMTRVHRNAGRKRQTLAQSSFAAWHKYYKQDENSPNAITSYYQQGALAALCLDLMIREKSEFSLDFVMQNLYARCLKTGLGTDEKQWQELAQEFIQLDLQDFFQAALYSTDDLPLKECLKFAGIELRWLPESRNDLGQLVGEFPEYSPKSDLGCRIKQNADNAMISHVFSGSSAEHANLKPNDKIIAIDGFICTDFIAQTQTKIGDTHRIHFFRHGVLHETHLTVQVAENTCAYLKIVDEQAFYRWIGYLR